MKKTQFKKHNNSGISLIALLLIIIILLTLVGIAIYLTIGKNQTFEKTQEPEGISTQKESKQTESIDSSILKLKVGDYINYDTGVSTIGNNGIVTFRVLYPADSKYGLQIVSDKNITTLVLGGKDFETTEGTFNSDFETAKNSYNNAIALLNKETEKYINSNYAYDSRSIGSIPTTQNGKFINKNQENEGPVTMKFPYNGSTIISCKGDDMNYTEDEIAMKSGNISSTGESYWIASRYVESQPSRCYFAIRYTNSAGAIRTFTLCSLDSKKDTQNGTRNKYGIRPCISLKSDSIKIISGDGTSENTAYIIGK